MYVQSYVLCMYIYIYVKVEYMWNTTNSFSFVENGEEKYN